MKRAAILCLFFLCACDSGGGDCARSRLTYPAAYPAADFQPSPHLGFGWANQSGRDIDPVAIEERLLTMQEELRAVCLSLAGALDLAWDCRRAKLDCDQQFNFACLNIKVVRPVLSQCTTMGDGITEEPVELLDVPAPDAGCMAKGLTPSPECPCRYRMIQQGNTVITTPTVYLYDLIERWTSCANYWASPFKAAAYSDMRRAGQLPKSMWGK